MSQGRSATSSAPASVITTRDYSQFSAYIEDQGLLLYEGEGAKNTVSTIEIEVPQTDTRTNANEMPDALGRHYSQDDFSHGAGQGFLHKQSSDPAKFNYSEGFDISKPGLLKHLPAVLTNVPSPAFSGATGCAVQAGGKYFIADDDDVLVFTSITSAPSVERPASTSPTVVIEDLTSEGDRVFAACGNDGVYVRSAAGTWTFFSAVEAIRIAFVKDTIIACSARILYELNPTTGAATAKLTLREGWTFTDIGENGPFIYAPAINANAGLCKIHHFGIDDALTLQPQGSSWLPNNELCYSFKGYLGIVFLGCGRVNVAGGKDALLYKATPDSQGFLSISLVADSTGAGARDLAVKSLATKGRNVLLGWTLGTASPFGVREGLALYDPALDAFSHHLASSLVTATPDPVLSVSMFAGRIVFVTTDGIYYEDTTKYLAQAFIIPSTGNFGRPNLKNWDESSLSTTALPATASVDIQYSQTTPEAGDWSVAGQHTITGATEATFDHPNLDSADFTVKIVSNATSSQALAPEIKTFSVRSNPTVADTPYLVLITVRIFDRDSLGENGQEVRQNPVAVKKVLEALHLTWVDFYTSDVPGGYHVRVKNLQVFQPLLPIYSTTTGEEMKNGYLCQLELRGTRN